MSELGMDEYQCRSFSTAVYPEKGTGSILAICYVALGLGESGELQGKVKKVLRDNNMVLTEEVRQALKKETGDLLWYVAAMATELDFTLSEIAGDNLDKLFSRKERGVIQGSGDDR